MVTPALTKQPSVPKPIWMVRLLRAHVRVAWKRAKLLLKNAETVWLIARPICIQPPFHAPIQSAPDLSFAAKDLEDTMIPGFACGSRQRRGLAHEMSSSSLIIAGTRGFAILPKPGIWGAAARSEEFEQEVLSFFWASSHYHHSFRPSSVHNFYRWQYIKLCRLSQDASTRFPSFYDISSLLCP